jgi:hypothetical protein
MAAPEEIAEIKMDPFLNENAWAGGTFDALMYFGPTSLEQTKAIAERLWSYSRLNGPYRERHHAIAMQEKVTPIFTEDGCEQLVGLYRFGDEELSPFVHTTVQCDDGLWVYAGIPMGGFPSNWNVGPYPFDDGRDVSWVLEIVRDLRELVAFLRSSFFIPAAAYGWFDVSILDTIEDALNGRLHDDRWHPIELQTGTELKYYPITKLEPLFQGFRINRQDT